MQQVAVNIVSDRSEDAVPVFSVNGPLGTGKTTMLKELTAGMIVEKAKLAAKFAPDDPDDLFDDSGEIKKEYREINSYGILVTAPSNEAAENISMEFPKGETLFDDVSGGDTDVYFREFAGKGCWGLISAPLGKSIYVCGGTGYTECGYRNVVPGLR